MAIQAPNPVAADPVGSWAKTFNQADASARDYARLQLEQQRLANQAVQQARENKANDFKLMLAAVNQEGEAEDRALRREQFGITNELSRFNADTSRMNAYTSRDRAASMDRYNGDPLGLGDPGMGGSSAPAAGGSAYAPPGKYNFGGISFDENGWGETSATVFGGGNDPDDNGLSAFGGKTGAGGREGVAVPEKILRQMFGDDRKKWENAVVEVETDQGTTRLPVADLGTAEFVWEREGKPTLDLTPGAVKQLGGEVIYRNGKMAGVRGVNIKNVKVLGAGSEPAAAASPPDLSGPEMNAGSVGGSNLTGPEMMAPPNGANLTGPEMMAPMAVPTSNDEDERIGLPPPVLSVPSFGDTDITQETRNKLFNLYRDNAGLTKTATIASQEAAMTRAAMKQVRDPALRERYRAAYADQATTAENAAAAANEAKYRAANEGKSMAVLQKRQDELSALAHLDGVLPEADRQKLLTDAADLKTGGTADRTIATLKAYDSARQTFGLEHQSNGIKTAEQVARLGLAMATPEAAKDREESQKAEVYRKLIADDEAKPDGEREDPDTVKEWKKSLNQNLAGDMQWKNREAAFKSAVKKDTLIPPTVEEGAVVSAPAAAPAAPVVKDVISQANAAAAKPSDEMSAEDQAGWTQAKMALRNNIGGKKALDEAVARVGGVETLEDLKKALRTQMQATVQEGGRENTFISEVFPRGLPKNARTPGDVVDALAEDIWASTGRQGATKVVKGAAPISSDSRAKIDAIAAKFEKKA